MMMVILKHLGTELYKWFITCNFDVIGDGSRNWPTDYKTQLETTSFRNCIVKNASVKNATVCSKRTTGLTHNMNYFVATVLRCTLGDEHPARNCDVDLLLWPFGTVRDLNGYCVIFFFSSAVFLAYPMGCVCVRVSKK